MTLSWLVAFVMTPLVVIALGLGSVWLHERGLRRARHQPPTVDPPS